MCLKCSRTQQGRAGTLLPHGLASELLLSKEQLYEMFQGVLNIKKFEHQLLYNALQLDSADEQAAAIRRELDGRVQKVNEMEKVCCSAGCALGSSGCNLLCSVQNRKLMPKFVLKEMESLHIEELRSSINSSCSTWRAFPSLKEAPRASTASRS
ncbi:hypothetical protein HPB52_025034 [Rhipicephalus sanguineus]|uniref:Uncharacterized protein n=1 Tax=Rhipicephalus sanguineus TaxID=34632 RepID=A0A9D4SLP8_RHISA|nr:hypothetical protein HPB52_025034 [Rhipicephalus sanguineus]